MKKFLMTVVLGVATVCYSQDVLPDKPKPDVPLCIDEGIFIKRTGTKFSRSGKTFTELYEIVSDSLVQRFGIELRSSDSSFVRRVLLDGCSRELYHRMEKDATEIQKLQEALRKETVEFAERYGTSYEVWFYFKLLGILKKK